MRYDLYKDSTFVLTKHFPEGEQPTLNANKGRFLKYDPPSYDPATEKLVQTAVTAETTGEVAFTVTALTQAELDAAASKVAKANLAALDAVGVTRPYEDLIDVLVSKGVIALSDLPQVTRDRISAKKSDRQKVRP